MEDYRALASLGVLFLVGALTPAPLFAYERNTHKGISQATVEAYERFNGETFNTAEQEQIVQGSFDEDDGTRPLNHFFDPISNRGLSVLFSSWPMSRLWAQDTEAQANYCDWGFCSKRVGYNDKYFSSPTDYSWDRAIYEYVYGDKDRGLRALGHTLHLLQDSSVPAHVRNDQHLNHQGVGDPDPYEKFTNKFGVGGVAVPDNLAQPLFYQSLDEYLSSMASYTNRGFLSKDTLFKDFASPSLQGLDLRGDNFAYDRNDGHRVAFVKRIYDFSGVEKEVKISLDNATNDPSSFVLSDYWSFLSREAIRNGVGVIDLFFREVEREKQTKNIQKKNTSEAERRAKARALKGFNLVKSLYGSSLTQEDVAALNADVLASAALATEQIIPPRPPAPKEAPKPPTLVKGVETEAPIEEEPVEEEEPALPAIVENPVVPEPQPEATTTQPLLPPQPPESVSYGGAASAPEQQITVTAPVIDSPLEASYTNVPTVTVSGTASAGSTITVSYDEAGSLVAADTVADIDGNWSLSITPQEGVIALSANARDSDGNISATTTRSFTADRTAPDVSGFSVLECGYSLQSASCATLTTANTRVASTSADVSYYVAVADGAIVATSSVPQIQIPLSVGTHQLEVSAYDLAGNGATSTAISIEAIASPIIFNEVAWSGTSADAAAQWLELYNKSTSGISLSSVWLQVGTAEPIALSGSLAAETLYLIEHSETDTSVQSDAVLALSSLTAPTTISLLYAPGGEATSTIDSTPAPGVCSGAWCAGTDTTERRSMERKQANAASDSVSNWTSNNGFTKNGTDSAGGAIYGTPKAQNSESLPSIGYFCEPYTSSFVEDGQYEYDATVQGRCTYQASNVGGPKYGVVFIGTVGSSTALSFHLLGNAAEKFELEPPLPNPVEGMDVFATVFTLRQGLANEDVQAFTDFFQTGTPPPHLSYGVLRFTWSAPE